MLNTVCSYGRKYSHKFDMDKQKGIDLPLGMQSYPPPAFVPCEDRPPSNLHHRVLKATLEQLYIRTTESDGLTTIQ